MRVALDHPSLIYTGRIDDRDPKQPEFIFPATSLRFRFYGKKLQITMENRHGWGVEFMGTVIDGVQEKWPLADRGAVTFTMIDEAEEAEHEVLLFKRNASHEVVLRGLELSEGSRLLESAPNPARRMEVFGDSVSCGEVVEAVDYTGKEDPPDHNCYFSNSWYSYDWVLARKLGATLHDVSQGGIALMDGTGYFYPPTYWGMETVWNKTHYNPELSPATDWDFSRFTPHLVIVAIGQNDAYPRDFMKEEPDGAQAQLWKQKYRALIENLRGVYPDAVIVLMTTVLNHDPSWDEAIDGICRELKDPRIFHYLFARNGCATPGHPRIAEQEEMADELELFLEKLQDDGVDIWREA